MIHKLLFVLLTLALLRAEASGYPAFSYPPDHILSFVRHSFYNSIENSDSADMLMDYFVKGSGSSIRNRYPVLKAFSGATETLLAKHSFNPYVKLKYLQTGLAKIGEALETEPDNIEIRFLRYTILYHLPSILGYGEERMADAEVILRLLRNGKTEHISEKLVQGIYEFMLKSSDVSQRQKTEIRRQMEQAG
ncbi:MAG: hypothetical protein HRU80_00560 [Ignavibacteriales bacterium]|nr:MAG: hypothetical protein HRU80_00560 [Ignavibacteriales bacterium]